MNYGNNNAGVAAAVTVAATDNVGTDANAASIVSPAAKYRTLGNEINVADVLRKQRDNEDDNLTSYNHQYGSFEFDNQHIVNNSTFFSSDDENNQYQVKVLSKFYFFFDWFLY